MPIVPRKRLLGCTHILQDAFDEGYINTGLTVTKNEESVLHEVIHMTTLGMPWTWEGRLSPITPNLSTIIRWRIDDNLTAEQAIENELRTLAAEVVILRSIGGFKEGGEDSFLRKIREDQRYLGYDIPLLRSTVLKLSKADLAQQDAEQATTNILEWSKIEDRRRNFWLRLSPSER